MRSVIVHHCKHSFALVLRSQEGWSFSFSGDTQQCDALVRAAQGVTVMVHEATFENGLERDAEQKRHSTVNDALKVRMPCVLAFGLTLRTGAGVSPVSGHPALALHRCYARRWGRIRSARAWS